MKLILKALAILPVLALLINQAMLYWAVVFEGAYVSIAPFGNIVMVVVFWPLALLLGAWIVLRFAFNIINEGL